MDSTARRVNQPAIRARSAGKKPTLTREFFTRQQSPPDDPLKVADIGPLDTLQLSDRAACALPEMFDYILHRSPPRVERETPPHG